MDVEIWLKLLNAGVALGFATLHLFLYSYYRRARANLYYSLFAFGVAGRILTADVFAKMPETANPAVSFLSIAALAVAIFSFAFYLHAAFDRKIRLYFPIVAGFWLATVLAETIFKNPLGFSASGFLLGGLAVFEVFRTVCWILRERAGGGWIIGLGILLLVISPIKDLIGDGLNLDFSDTIDTIIQQISVYGIIIANSVFLARNFAHTNYKLEEQIEQVKKLSALQIEQTRANAELTLQNEKERARRALVEQELELAAGIQKGLFPENLPSIKNFDLAAKSVPARECGGDYYDAIQTSRTGYLFCVADVAGKGIPAALLMSNMQANLRALAEQTDSLADLAARIGELLYAASPANKFVTAVFVHLDSETGECRFVNAGHNECFLFRKNESEPFKLQSSGLPLGMLPGSVYEEENFKMQPEDSLVLFSDGVPEAQNPSEEEWGENRFIESLKSAEEQSADSLVERILSELNRFGSGAPQHDDITLLILNHRR